MLNFAPDQGQVVRDPFISEGKNTFPKEDLTVEMEAEVATLSLGAMHSIGHYSI